MIVLFTVEFKSMYNKMSAADQKKAGPFFRQVWADLKEIQGPGFFQALPYTISMQARSKLEAALEKKIPLDKNDVVFSLTDNRFIILFAINLSNLGTLKMWSIKPR